MKARKQSSTSYPITFCMVSSSDHVSAVTGLSPTVTISKNGAGFGAAGGAVTEIGSGWYQLAGNATDRNTLGELLVHATGAGADPWDDRYLIVPFDPFDAAALGLTNLDAAVSSRALEAGGNLATVLADTNDLQTRLPAALVGGRIDASVGAMAAGVVDAAAIGTGAIDADAIAAGAITSSEAPALANLDAAVSSRAAAGDSMALTSGAVDAVLDEVVEGALTFRQMLRLFRAALAGKSAGGGTATITFRDLADTKARITATVDADGNRTAVTLDAS